MNSLPSAHSVTSMNEVKEMGRTTQAGGMKSSLEAAVMLSVIALL